MKVQKYIVKKKTFASLNEANVLGSDVSDLEALDPNAPFSALNDDSIEIVTGPDGKSYNMDTIKSNVKMMYNAIAQEYPALSSFLSLLEPVYTFDVDTMATDGYHIFINPSFYVYLHQVKPFMAPLYVILHEIYHNLLLHRERFEKSGHPNHSKFNIAADHEINNMLEDQDPNFDGLTAQIGGIMDRNFHHMLWEDIYTLLKDDQNMQQQNTPSSGGSSSQGQGNSNSPSNHSGNSQGDGAEEQGNGSEGNSQGSGNNGQGNSGSGNNAKVSEGSASSNKQAKHQDVLSRSEGEKISKRAGKPYTQEQKNTPAQNVWKDAVKANKNSLDSLGKAVKSTGNPGWGVGSILKDTFDRLAPKVDWRKLLTKYMNDAYMEEGVKFPQKKVLYKDVYKRYEDEIDDGLRELAVLFDASGSVFGTNKALERFVSEITTIFKKVKITDGSVIPFCGDVNIKDIYKFKRRFNSDAFKLTMSGGTNYRAALEWMNEKMKKTDIGCVLILTDCDVIGGKHDMPVYKWMKKKAIWLVIHNYNGASEKEIRDSIPEGRVIIIPEEIS